MRQLAAMFVIAAGIALSACGTDRGLVYTGTNEDAAEGEWIKDPEARGTTRDISGRRDQSRTESNRVDIPVREFVTVASTSSTGAILRNSGFDARYVRASVAAGWSNHRLDARRLAQGYRSASSADVLLAHLNETRFPGMWSTEELNARAGRNGTRAYSALEQPWAETGSVPTESVHARDSLRAVKGNSQLEASKSQAGYSEAFGSRIVGLHLWKYADRELVTDAVEVTYTIVYYNMNEYDIGPTEILEPIPYYTQYMEGSATLPIEGTTVSKIQKVGERAYLRWNFPRGIKAGETSEMRYKVRVQLDSQYTPPDDVPGMPEKQ
jgi:hypothetical protein